MRVLVLFGVALYVSAFAVAGALTPGYRHATQLISELGAAGAPYAWLVRGMLVVVGAIVTAFAFDLRRKLRWTLGPAMIAIIGLGLVTGGVFNCDPACKPVTFSGWTHILSSIPATLCALVAPFLFARRLHGLKDPRFARASFAFGVASVLAIAAAFFVFPACGLNGLGQRLATAVQMLWMVLLAFA